LDQERATESVRSHTSPHGHGCTHACNLDFAAIFEVFKGLVHGRHSAAEECKRVSGDFVSYLLELRGREHGSLAALEHVG